jgi:hypothetical protein
MKRFSLRTMLAVVAVICVMLVVVLQETERRRLDAKLRYAVWHNENAQEYISARLDEDREWRSALIKKYSGTPKPEHYKELLGDMNKHTFDLRLGLSDAWLLTGWDSQDESQSVNGPPR